MDSAVANALKRRDELQKELRDVERFLSLYERFRTSSSQASLPGFDSFVEEEQEAIGSGLSVEPASVVNVETVSEIGNSDPAMKLNRRQMIPHIRDVILEAKRPLTRGLLLRRLEKRGVQVGGTYDRSKNMGTIMWRLRTDFVNLAGQGYWPRELPYEPVGYTPGEGDPEQVQPDLAESQD